MGDALLALPTNIILGWKGLPGTNTLAYLSLLKVAKSVLNIPPSWFDILKQDLKNG